MFYDSFSAFNLTETEDKSTQDLLESAEAHIFENIHWRSHKLTVIVVLSHFGEYSTVSNVY